MRIRIGWTGVEERRDRERGEVVRNWPPNPADFFADQRIADCRSNLSRSPGLHIQPSAEQLLLDLRNTNRPQTSENAYLKKEPKNVSFSRTTAL